jgi:hypothetical protein
MFKPIRIVELIAVSMLRLCACIRRVTRSHRAKADGDLTAFQSTEPLRQQSWEARSKTRAAAVAHEATHG